VNRSADPTQDRGAIHDYEMSPMIYRLRRLFLSLMKKLLQYNIAKPRFLLVLHLRLLVVGNGTGEPLAAVPRAKS